MYSILVAPDVIICDLSVWVYRKYLCLLICYELGYAFYVRSKSALGQLWIFSNRTEANTERRRGLFFVFLLYCIYMILIKSGHHILHFEKFFRYVLNSLIIFRIDNVKFFFFKIFIIFICTLWKYFTSEVTPFWYLIKISQKFPFFYSFFSNGNYRPTF